TRWPRDWSSDVCSSDLDHPGGVGDQRVVTEVLRVRFGQEPRELAPHVVVRGEARDVRAPRVEPSRANCRLAAVIQHEAGVGTLAYQVRDVAQLVVRGAEIEGEPATADRLNPLHECRLQAESG